MKNKCIKLTEQQESLQIEQEHNHHGMTYLRTTYGLHTSFLKAVLGTFYPHSYAYRDTDWHYTSQVG